MVIWKSPTTDDHSISTQTKELKNKDSRNIYVVKKLLSLVYTQIN